MPLIVKCNNGIVTDTYLEIIGEALSLKSNDVRYTSDINAALFENKDEVIVVARTVDAFKLLSKGYRKVVVWFQGVEPEESFMIHNSKIRYWVLSYMEKVIMRKAFFMFFVSQEMKLHYERKYRILIDRQKFYCMPCMNTQINKDAFECSEKYRNNYFAYIGSLAVWQNFNETIRAYSQIEKSGLTNCKLFIFTSQQEEAKRICNEEQIKNYSISYVTNDELPIVLNNIKYGFIIRDDTIVNRVATPTKISTYLSCGLIPIYSTCLKDFSALADTMEYVVKYDDTMIDSLKIMETKITNNQQVFDEYNQVFETHYSRKTHVEKIERLLSI